MTKYSLIIGINYKGTKSELNGCINDAVNIKQVLQSKFNFKEENIIMLTEENGNLPTAFNIVNNLNSLINKANTTTNSEVWIHYSGHGSYINDTNGDEKDGKDEVIVPLDYMTSGVITDDYLHQQLSGLNSDAKCFCFFDCCHSGTIIDLKYKYNFNTNINEIENSASNITSKIVAISGCKDCQTSADFYNANCSNWAGAMTTALIDTLNKNNIDISIFNLVDQIRNYLLTNNFKQIPQLTSSFEITNLIKICNKNGNLLP